MTDIAVFWWVLSALSVGFILVDWTHAPIDIVMHVGFVLIVAFMAPLGLLLYVLTVREPLPGTHRAYIAPRWKQVVGSTFHCVAGDSVGIVGAAIITAPLRLPVLVDLLIEYAVGFIAGWLIFQALFMKDMVGGSYVKAVRVMFMPEWLSMNGVMAGMALVMVGGMKMEPLASQPGHPAFWFLMSLALMAGAMVAYPLNWWLVAHHLKHGLMSTTDGPVAHAHHDGAGDIHRGHSEPASGSHPYASPVVAISFGVLVGALALSLWVG